MTTAATEQTAAIASRGQLVVLELPKNATDRQIDNLRLQLDQLAAKTGVYFAVLFDGVRVARIQDGPVA